MRKFPVLSGVDRLSTVDHLLKGRRIGLMTNPTGIDHHFVSTIDLIHQRYQLTALYAVEHGIRGDIQAGVHVEDKTIDPTTGVMVYSAYGTHRHFTDEMLDAFDVLVFDMQDVGARFYTYLYSLSYAMEGCAKAGKPVVVLDRINPLGGVKRTGTILDTAFTSFVGGYALPTQYALTIGEYARYVKDYLSLDIDLTVVPLEGWSREMCLDDTDLPWVAPSPNCADLASALCYTGTCIFEGSNCSEGRGTTYPFQVVGAPFIDREALAVRLNALHLPGLYYRPTTFVPTFSKHEGKACHGVQMHITDREHCDAFAGGLMLMDAIRQMYPNDFEFLQWGQGGKFAVDNLLGTDAYRTGRLSADELIETSREPVKQFGEKVKPYLLY